MFGGGSGNCKNNYFFQVYVIRQPLYCLFIMILVWGGAVRVRFAFRPQGGGSVKLAGSQPAWFRPRQENKKNIFPNDFEVIKIVPINASADA